MYNQKLVTLCETLVKDSITNRTQIRTHFGTKESLPFVKFKTACSQCNFDYLAEFGSMPLNEIVFIIAHNGNVHKCHCSKPTEFISIARGYSVHCSKSCKYSDPAYIQKQKDAKINMTAEEKEAVAAKRAATNTEKFGAEFAMQNREIASKQAAAQRNKAR